MTTTELYQFRSKSLAKVKRRLIKKGHTITTLSATEKRLKVADFNMSGKPTKFKSAKNRNVNILFESINNNNYGFIVTTKAKYFIMYYEEPDIAYVIDIEKVRKYINNPLNIIQTTDKGSKGRKTSQSYMIPIDALKKHDIIIDVIRG